MTLYQKIFAIIFMVALMGFAILNVSVNFHGMKVAFSEIETPKELEDVKAYTAEIDNLTANNLLFDHAWNEAYAMVYNALGKNEENSFTYVRDKNGMLYSGNFWNTASVPTREYVKRLNVIRKKLEGTDTKLVVLMYPQKYYEKWSDGYTGIPYNDFNLIYDELTAYFRYYSIDYIDYREYFLEHEWKVDEIFFAADHHWTIEAAFAGNEELVNHLNEKYEANLDTYYTNIDNYDVVTYAESYIGSQGRDAGIAYVGLDDFTLITPKFETDYYIRVNKGDNVWGEDEGDIFETLIRTSYLEKEDYYDKDLYSIYLSGVLPQQFITNKDNEDGLNVLFIRDSFSSPLAVFFSPYCSQMDMYWSIHSSSEEMETAIETGGYDYIFIGLAVDSIVYDGLEIYVDEELTNE